MPRIDENTISDAAGCSPSDTLDPALVAHYLPMVAALGARMVLAGLAPRVTTSETMAARAERHAAAVLALRAETMRKIAEGHYQ